MGSDFLYPIQRRTQILPSHSYWRSPYPYKFSHPCCKRKGLLTQINIAGSSLRMVWTGIQGPPAAFILGIRLQPSSFSICSCAALPMPRRILVSNDFSITVYGVKNSSSQSNAAATTGVATATGELVTRECPGLTVRSWWFQSLLSFLRQTMFQTVQQQ